MEVPGDIRMLNSERSLVTFPPLTHEDANHYGRILDTRSAIFSADNYCASSRKVRPENVQRRDRQHLALYPTACGDTADLTIVGIYFLNAWPVPDVCLAEN